MLAEKRTPLSASNSSSDCPEPIATQSSGLGAITIGIPAYALPYLNTRQKRIPVYSIQVKGQTLLEAAYTLKKNSDNNLLIAGLIVLLAGLVYYFSRRKKEVVSR